MSVSRVPFCRKTKIQMLTTSCRSLTLPIQSLFKSIRLYYSPPGFSYLPTAMTIAAALCWSFKTNGRTNRQRALVFCCTCFAFKTICENNECCEKNKNILIKKYASCPNVFVKKLQSMHTHKYSTYCTAYIQLLEVTHRTSAARLGQKWVKNQSEVVF